MGINLKNIIWTRDPQEAMDNPYEWDAQKKFVKEANDFLRKIRKHIIENTSFTKDDRSKEKAIWMLSLAALDSAIEITISLKRNQIHVIYHLLRSIREALDLAIYFDIEDTVIDESISKWFDGEIIQHGEYRSYVGKKINKAKEDHLKNIHRALSKFNHNSYQTLLYSYFLDDNGGIHHYGRYESDSTKPVNTIAMLHAVSAQVILELSFQLPILKVLDTSVLLDFIGDQKRKRIVRRKYQIKINR